MIAHLKLIQDYCVNGIKGILPAFDVTPNEYVAVDGDELPVVLVVLNSDTKTDTEERWGTSHRRTAKLFIQTRIEGFPVFDTVLPATNSIIEFIQADDTLGGLAIESVIHQTIFDGARFNKDISSSQIEVDVTYFAQPGA